VQTDGGALQFVGRADDVIKVAGENVSLTEVEAILAQAPGVLEVAVVPRPDEIRDVVPVAYIVARDQADPPDVDDLAEWAGRQLAPQARPREWHLIDSLPRTSVGKVRRFKIGTDTAG
jgi:crotonobetaine/carnitine-CoA ligase